MSHSNDLEKYYDLIKKEKENGVQVIVNIHWGHEYHENPSQDQKDMAHSLIDSGADIIIGHYPHVIQPVEIYKNKAVFYSLGDFIFDQIGEKTNEGIGAGVILDRNKIGGFLFPYETKNYQPVLMSPQESKSFCDGYLSGVPDHNGCEFEIKS